MIKLLRTKDPDSIPEKYSGENNTKLQIALAEEFKSIVGDKEISFKNSTWKKAKQSLLKESSQKCAYCESSFTTVAFGDVEHFRPKSKYWWLAYYYTNYSASCAICNRTNKSDKFDLVDETKKLTPPAINFVGEALKEKIIAYYPDPFENSRELSSFNKKLLEEQSKLIDPYLEEPANFFSYEFNGLNKEVYIRPKPRLRQKKKSRANYTISLLDLNRSELLSERYFILETFNLFKIINEAPNSGKKVKKITKYAMDKMRESERPYSGMLKYYVNNPLESIIGVNGIPQTRQVNF